MHGWAEEREGEIRSQEELKHPSALGRPAPGMDRRSWLWRRKSPDKSSAETETSASSASERFTDEQVWNNINHPLFFPSLLLPFAHFCRKYADMLIVYLLIFCISTTSVSLNPES
jgi:hypothetical protein